MTRKAPKKKRDANKERLISGDSKDKVKPNEVKPKSKLMSSDIKQKSIPSDVKKKEGLTQAEEKPKTSKTKSMPKEVKEVNEVNEIKDVTEESVLSKVEDNSIPIDVKNDVITAEIIPQSMTSEDKEESPDPVTELTELVSSDTIQSTVKHPLNSKWTLWYYLPEKDGRDWELCQHQIHTVNTIEDFWSLMDHVKQPSELTNGVDYSFFKNGIRPMWEDPQNREGGRMTVINTSKCRQAAIDEIWLDVLLFLVGENFEHTDDVCGMVLNVRNYGFKLAVWTTHANTNIIRSIGINLKKNLCTPPNQPITFELHSETLKNAQTYGRASSRSFFTI